MLAGILEPNLGSMPVSTVSQQNSRLGVLTVQGLGFGVYFGLMGTFCTRCGLRFRI